MISIESQLKQQYVSAGDDVEEYTNIYSSVVAGLKQAEEMNENISKLAPPENASITSSNSNVLTSNLSALQTYLPVNASSLSEVDGSEELPLDDYGF